MQNRMKLVVAGLASALAIAVVALGVVAVALRPEADASPQSPAAGAAPVHEAVDAPGAQGEPAAPVVVVSPTGGNGGGTTVSTTTPPTTTPPTTTPPTTQPPGGGGGGTKPPRPPLDDILGDPPLVLDPGPSGPSTTTPTLPPNPCKLPFKLCP